MVGDKGFVHRRRSLGRHSYIYTFLYDIPTRHSHDIPIYIYIYIIYMAYIYMACIPIYIYIQIYGIPIRHSYTGFLYDIPGIMPQQLFFLRGPCFDMSPSLSLALRSVMSFS